MGAHNQWVKLNQKMQCYRKNLTRWAAKDRKYYARILNLKTNQLKELQDREELKDVIALNQRGSFKSPNLDGFNADFFQSYWHIVGNNVYEAILKCLNQDLLDEKTKYTYIVLIPKVKNSLTTSDYKPISLCNVVYKLIYKFLTNRLKKLITYLGVQAGHVLISLKVHYVKMEEK